MSYKRLKELNRDLSAVFAGAGKSECLRRGEEMAQRWEKSSREVAAMLRDGLEDCLTVENFPEDHRRRLRSTNLLQNMMKRLRSGPRWWECSRTAPRATGWSEPNCWNCTNGG